MSIDDQIAELKGNAPAAKKHLMDWVRREVRTSPERLREDILTLYLAHEELLRLLGRLYAAAEERDRQACFVGHELRTKPMDRERWLSVLGEHGDEFVSVMLQTRSVLSDERPIAIAKTKSE